MILTEPISFAAVEKLIRDKKIKVTGLSSAEISRRRDEFNIRGLFSAKTLNAQLLQGYADQLKDAGSQSDIATMRVKMKQLIDELEIAPPSEDEAGTITDFGSNARIGLILRTNLDMARGFGQYMEGMTEGALAAFPALELVREEDRMVPREWIEIWDLARSTLGDATTATSAEDTGRMVAKKGDPIWLAISDFGQPWPPFKFNSGMGVEDVDWDDAVALGVVRENEDVQPEAALGFNDHVGAGIADLSDPLLKVLEDDLQGFAEKDGDMLRLTSDDPLENSRRRCDEALFILNSGTSEGSLKGWETRRMVNQISKAHRRILSRREDQTAVMHKPGLGRIDFVYGRPGSARSGVKDDGYGHSHMKVQHPEDLKYLPRTLVKGSVYGHEQPSKRYIVHGSHIAVLSQQREKDRETSPSRNIYDLSRYSVTTHYKDARQALKIEREARHMTSLSNSSQTSLGNLTHRTTSSVLLSGAVPKRCCQELQSISAAACRQRIIDTLEILEEAA